MTMRVIVTLVVILVACERTPDSSVRAQTAQFPTSTLDQLLSPVALYPDQLLAQILMSATEPAKVIELDKWLKANPQLKGTPLQDAAVKAGFDPSFVALTLFPQVVAQMVEQIAWTTSLGQAFASDRNAVFGTIQSLRQQAKNVGTLKTTAQQEVTTTTTSAGQEVIVIEPANPQVVYVPQYNPTVVYTQAPTTVVVQDDDDDAEEAIAAGLVGFTAGIAIGAAFDNDYYYGPYGWRGGAYMYNEAWDDYYDAREDAREDWMDHREDLGEERGDVAQNRQEQRTDRREATGEQRTERRETTSQQRTERAETRSAGTSNTSRVGSTEARGHGGSQSATQRSGSSDAFSGYSSGRSTQSASSRGQRSRGSSRGGGGRRR
jgi:Protein of unknown function (DUF3300)